MSYESGDFDSYLQEAFDKYLIDKFDTLMQKHLPIVDNLIKERISGNNWTPEVSAEFSRTLEAKVQTAVGNFMRCGHNEINSLIQKAYENQIDKIIENKVHEYIARKTNKVLEALK